MTPAAFPAVIPADRERWTRAGLWLERTLCDYFDETAARLPERIAIVAGDLRLTFSAWADEAARVAAGLVRLGIRPGDVVTVQLPNWPEMCILQIALARIGAVIQPMHVTYRQREMAAMLGFCESRAVVVPAHHQGFDYAAALAEIRRDLPALTTAITVRGRHDGMATWEDLRASYAGLPDHHGAHRVGPDDPFYLNFTSGTEGDPKGFVHTHNTLLSVLKRFADLQHAADPTASDDVILANSPMTHSFGHLTTYQVAMRGIRMVLVERFSPGETLALIARERVTAISGTPAHLITLLNHPAFAATDTSSVKSVGVGGAQCPPQLMEDIERTFGVRIGNMYGMGENVVHTRTLPTDPPAVVRETVGLPVPGAEVAIFADDHQTRLAGDAVGEIAFRGPSLCLGYYKQPELTRATRTADGWFLTGDLGFVDAQGYLHLAGRKKELINRGGTKIFPKEIEDLLHAHPKIVRAAVVGMPDYRLGERVCAYVELVPGASLDLHELRADLERQQVTKLLIPERLEVVEALPLTPTGKVKKAPLVADVTARLASTKRTS